MHALRMISNKNQTTQKIAPYWNVQRGAFLFWESDRRYPGCTLESMRKKGSRDCSKKDKGTTENEDWTRKVQNRIASSVVTVNEKYWKDWDYLDQLPFLFGHLIQPQPPVICMVTHDQWEANSTPGMNQGDHPRKMRQRVPRRIGKPNLIKPNLAWRRHLFLTYKNRFRNLAREIR